MKNLRITHRTEYFYREPVEFGIHHALVRPREGHDVHIQRSILEIEPHASIRWVRDTYGNSIAILGFTETATRLSMHSEVVVSHYEGDPLNFVISPDAAMYPFQYSMDEAPELIPYRLAGYPRDGSALRQWAEALYRPGQIMGTFDLLAALNSTIHSSLQYSPRDEPGVQSPAETLSRGGGSCRDYAALMMETARHWGFGARFVTGYIQMENNQHGATHAWTEIYIPGAGWKGFDPTNNKVAGAEHVSVAVARDPEKASPLSGTWKGSAGAFERMSVDVRVAQE